MPEQQGAAAQASSKESVKVVFNPVKDDPAGAERFVRAIFKHDPNNIDLVSAELAPLYGFGPNSNQDVLARSRAQAVFVSPGLEGPLGGFLRNYTRNEWNLPVANFTETLALIHEHRHEWTNDLHPLSVNKATVEQHYARFVIHMLNELENPDAPGSYMLKWLRVVIGTEREDDACWVLFHALMYLQLKAMELNRSRAPLKKVAEHYFDKFTGHDSWFNKISKFISARKGLGENSIVLLLD